MIQASGRRGWYLVLAAAVAAAVLGMGAVRGEELTVDDDGGADFTQVQDAIFAILAGTSDANTIRVYPGEYAEINYFGLGITITSLEPEDPNIVAGTVIQGSGDYAVIFEFGEDPNSVLTGFTVLGGVNCYGSSSALMGNVISHAPAHGVLGEYDAEPVLLYNTIEYAGGEAVLNCRGIIQENTILNNDANGLNLCDGLVLGNEIRGNGGAGIIDCYADITYNDITANARGVVNCPGVVSFNRIESNTGLGVSDCGSLHSNSISYNGAGGVSGSDGDIFNNVILGNGGPGLAACTGAIYNNEICGNAAEYGGGLYECGGSIENNTIVGNKATAAGGAIYNCPGLVRSNIIAWNMCPGTGGGGIYGTCVNSYNCLWQNTMRTFAGGAFVGAGDLIADPEFVLNGNWSDVEWLHGDYHLRSAVGRWDPEAEEWVRDAVSSPCIDAGHPDAYYTAEPYPNGERCNLGVWGGTLQASKSPRGQTVTCAEAIEGNLVNDINAPSWCKIDFLDMRTFYAVWQMQEPLASLGISRQWALGYDAQSQDDQCADMVIDAEGFVYVLGYSEIDGDYDISLVKYDPNGTEAWGRHWDGPESGDDDYAQAMTLDGEGNVILTGWTWTPATQRDCVTIKYDPNGVHQWTAVYAGPLNDRAYDVAADPAGNVYITGNSETGAGVYDYITLRYNADGSDGWCNWYNGPDNLDDFATKITVTALGDVVVAGRSGGTSTGDDIALVWYDPWDGMQKWARRWDGQDSLADMPKDLAADTAGTVYVSGTTGTSANGLDIFLLGYDTQGDILWSGAAQIDGSAGSEDSPEALAIYPAGNIILTGMTTRTDTGKDMSTFKISAADGTILWEQHVNGYQANLDQGLACTVDQTGTVYAAGKSRLADTSFDYLVLKYSTEGEELYSHRYGWLTGSDTPKAVTADKTGNFYAAGTGHGPDGSNDFLTLKFSEDFACQAQLTGDFNQDCRVGLEDFALLLSNWLACNLEPIQACTEGIYPLQSE